jgi:hypothetical protein
MEYGRSSSLVISQPLNLYAVVEGMNRIAAYDFMTSTCKTIEVEVIFPKNCSWALYQEHWLVVTGGKQAGKPTNEASMISTLTREVRRLPELPGAIYDHCSVIWQDLLFVFGGYDSDLNTAYSFQKGQWEVLSLPRVKSLKPYACIFQDKIIVSPRYGSTTFEVIDPATLHLTTFQLRVETPLSIVPVAKQLILLSTKVQSYTEEEGLSPGFAAEKNIGLWSQGPILQVDSKLYLLRWLGCRFVEVDLENSEVKAVSIDLRQLEPEVCALCPNGNCLTSAECNWSRRRGLLMLRET